METLHAAADYVQSRLGGVQPVVGIVLGSGLGKLSNEIEHPLTIP